MPRSEPLFCDTALAARIERVEADLMAKASESARARTPGFVTRIAGGTATFAAPDSPFNKVAGLGFGGMPEDAELDEGERAFAAFDSPVHIELANLGDTELGARLTQRGYSLDGFENVLGMALDGARE